MSSGLQNKVLAFVIPAEEWSDFSVHSRFPKARSAPALKLIFQTEPLRDCPKTFPSLFPLGRHFFRCGGSQEMIFHILKITLKRLGGVTGLRPPRACSNARQLIIKPLRNADDAMGRSGFGFAGHCGHVQIVSLVTYVASRWLTFSFSEHTVNTNFAILD